MLPGLRTRPAWVDDEGRPRALPTIQARIGDTLYLHGSRGARAWKAIAAGAEVCVVATIVDELVRHLGGRLKITSSPQTSTGTTVRVVIPTASHHSSDEGPAAP